MKEYQHRRTTVKAVKYQEGMEDAWIVQYERYIEDNAGTTIHIVDKIFKSKDEARKYVASPTDETIRSVTNKTIEETKKYIEFKTAGTEGIKECEIRSIILPLLADHVLREANHYLRILKD